MWGDGDDCSHHFVIPGFGFVTGSDPGLSGRAHSRWLRDDGKRVADETRADAEQRVDRLPAIAVQRETLRLIAAQYRIEASLRNPTRAGSKTRAARFQTCRRCLGLSVR